MKKWFCLFLTLSLAFMLSGMALAGPAMFDGPTSASFPPDVRSHYGIVLFGPPNDQVQSKCAVKSSGTDRLFVVSTSCLFDQVPTESQGIEAVLRKKFTEEGGIVTFISENSGDDVLVMGETKQKLVIYRVLRKGREQSSAVVFMKKYLGRPWDQPTEMPLGDIFSFLMSIETKGS